LLSATEFCLASGWLLAYRYYEVLFNITPMMVPGWLELKEAMSALPSIPEPIAHYLEGLGLYRDAYGHTLCPQLVLPHFDTHDDTCGMLPSDFATHTQTVPSLGGAMFPFGLLERQIAFLGPNNGLANRANFQTRVDPANANPAVDVYLTRTGTFPVVIATPATTARTAQMPQSLFTQNQPQLLNAIRWRTDTFRSFCDFIRSAASSYSHVSYPTSKAGSPAMTSAVSVSFPAINMQSDGYQIHAYMALNNSEQHASRLFRYRRSRTVNADGYVANDVNRNRAMTDAPGGLNGDPPLMLTEVRQHSIYLDHYTRHFMTKT